MTILARRAGAALIAAMLLAAPAVAAEMDVVYAISRGDERIGERQLRVSQDGDEVEVRIKSSAQMRYQLVESYQFQHEAREVWRSGRLVEFRSRTVDNVRNYEVRLDTSRAPAALIAVGREAQVPPEITPLSLWSASMLYRPAYFDSFTGRVVQVKIRDLGSQEIELSGQRMRARHYVIEGDAARDLWYVNGTLVRQWQTAPDGSTVSYEMQF